MVSCRLAAHSHPCSTYSVNSDAFTFESCSWRYVLFTCAAALLQEYNYVKHIAKKLANKHIAHLVLLGGDADCFQLIETALADGVSCELLYQPYGVSKVLLQGVHQETRYCL